MHLHVYPILSAVRLPGGDRGMIVAGMLVAAG
jgi:hypothetical protein